MKKAYCFSRVHAFSNSGFLKNIVTHNDVYNICVAKCALLCCSFLPCSTPRCEPSNTHLLVLLATDSSNLSSNFLLPRIALQKLSFNTFPYGSVGGVPWDVNPGVKQLDRIAGLCRPELTAQTLCTRLKWGVHLPVVLGRGAGMELCVAPVLPVSQLSELCPPNKTHALSLF